MTAEMRSTFSYVDYGVFILMLVMSAAIGFYYAWAERNKRTLDRMLLGGRKLKIFPVAMSIMASFTSAVSVLGFSVEMYRFGSMYLLIGLSYFITQPFAAAVYVPFFHRLNVTSAYEYLEKRFNYQVRLLASIIFCIEMFLYMAVVLYSPSLAIQQVTGIPLWVSIFVTGFVCTIYTSLGGMKAVVFTDTFQVFIMFSGLLAIMIEGTRRVGGVGIVIERFVQGDRLEFFDFNPSPFERHTFWSIMIGGFFTSLTVYGSNQATIQRYLALPTIRDAQFAMYWNLLGTLMILVFCCVCGIVCYAFYFDCDPYMLEKITRYDQMLPYFVMDILKNYYGLAGLFIACVYSAALSTVSSGLNSLVAVFMHDFIYPFNVYMKKDEISQKMSMILSKLLAAIFGVFTIGLSFLCQYAGTTVLQISLSIFGILGGPLLGVISLGMFVPFANEYGALVGLVVSVAVNMWISIGSFTRGNPPKSKPLRFDGCPGFNTSNFTETKTMKDYLSKLNIVSELKPNTFEFGSIYRVSYYWFSLIGICIVFFFGITVSLAFKPKCKRRLEPNLTIDLRKKLRRLFCMKSKEVGLIDEKQAEANLLEDPAVVDSKF